MIQFEQAALSNQEDYLGVILAVIMQQNSNLPGPDDDDFDDDDDDFDVETGDDIETDDEDWDEPEVVPDDDEEEIVNKGTTEGDALESGELDVDFEDRPYTTRRHTGRMIDHEPGTSGFEPPL